MIHPKQEHLTRWLPYDYVVAIINEYRAGPYETYRLALMDAIMNLNMVQFSQPAVREEIRKACEVEFKGIIDQLERDLASMTDERNANMQELEIHRADYDAWKLKADQPRPWWRRVLGIVEQRDFWELERRSRREQYLAHQKLRTLHPDDGLQYIDWSPAGFYEHVTGTAALIEERQSNRVKKWILTLSLGGPILGASLMWLWMTAA